MKSIVRHAVAAALVLAVSLPGSADAAFWGYDSAQMPCDNDRVVTPCPGAAAASETGMMDAFSGMMGRWFGGGASTAATATTQTAETKTTTTAPSSEAADDDAEATTAYQNL